MSVKTMIFKLSPWHAGILATAFIAVAVIGGIYAIWEIAEATERHDAEVTWGPGECSVLDMDSAGRFLIHCQGNPHWVSGLGMGLSYVLNPGPLTCSVYGDRYARCRPRPFKPVASN